MSCRKDPSSCCSFSGSCFACSTYGCCAKIGGSSSRWSRKVDGVSGCSSLSSSASGVSLRKTRSLQTQRVLVHIDEFEVGNDLRLDEHEASEFLEGHGVAGLRIHRENDLDVFLGCMLHVHHRAALAIPTRSALFSSIKNEHGVDEVEKRGADHHALALHIENAEIVLQPRVHVHLPFIPSSNSTFSLTSDSTPLSRNRTSITGLPSRSVLYSRKSSSAALGSSIERIPCRRSDSHSCNHHTLPSNPHRDKLVFCEAREAVIADVLAAHALDGHAQRGGAVLQNVLHDALLHSLDHFQRDLQIPTRQTPIASRLQRGIRLCGVDLPFRSDSKEKTGEESMFRTDIRMLICLVMD